jgi:uncharacterized Zn-binding protein involved in type VI secretion
VRRRRSTSAKRNPCFDRLRYTCEVREKTLIPQIATLGNSTSHGTPLFPGTGSANVFLRGKPVWRALIDFHTCPLFNGPVAHVDGAVLLPVCKRMLLNGLPAAQEGVVITEPGGTPNTILLIG